ncbi:MAG: ABC transporter permease, partial [candidate division WOR-3 bacterium]
STGKLYEALKEGRVKCGLVFPYNFSKDKVVKGFSEIQVLVDGSDANLAKKVQQTVQRFFIESELNVRFLYIPELKSRNFVIPGLIVVLMTMLGVILTTLSIVGEKERGNFEMLSTTPVKSHVILLGKIIPYGTIAIINVFIITGFAIIVFKVPFKGNFFILLLYSLLFLFPTLSLGAMISSYAQTELTALTTALAAAIASSGSSA